MKKILIVSVLILLFVPSVSFAGSRFGNAFESGAGWELGRLAANMGVAIVGGALGGGYYTHYNGYYYNRPVRYYDRPVRYYRGRYDDNRYYGKRIYRRSYRHGFRHGYTTGYGDGYYDGSYGYRYRRW